MLELKTDFTDRQLLWFGPLLALFVGLIGLVLWQRFDLAREAFVLGCLTAVVIVLYYLFPAIRKPTYRAWLYAFFPIGWVVSHVLIAAVFYFVLTPIGLIMRCVGYDPMNRAWDDSAKTYWIDRESTVDTHRYFRQF